MHVVNGVDASKLDSLIDLLETRIEQHPHQLAFSFLRNGEVESEALTFAELGLRVRSLAAYLQQLGLAGRSALMLYPAGTEFVVAFHACMYAGVTAIPAVLPRVNRALSNLDAIMADAGAAIVLTTASQLGRLQPLYADAQSDARREVIATDLVDASGANRWLRPIVRRTDLAFLQYTSGSTGAPKGVMVGHGNLLHNLEMLRHFFESSGQECFVSWLPHYHDMGLIGAILQAIYVGAPCHLMSPSSFVKKPACWLQAISRYRATISGAPNFAYQHCIERVTEEQLLGVDLSSWRIAYNGAEPIRASTMRAFQKRFAAAGLRPNALFASYGMAEATLVISADPVDAPYRELHVDKIELERNVVVPVSPDHPNGHALVGCGRASARALDDAQIRIVDPVDGRLLPARQIGEIWVSSASVCQGYLSQPESSDAVYRSQHPDVPGRTFARSGDLGFLEHDGQLFITGRLKDVLIIRGRNYYPQDIEVTVQASHAQLAIDGGAAFAVEVDGQERVVIAQEVTREAASAIDVDAIVAAASAALSDGFELQLHAIELLRPGRLPKTSSGKIQRSRARREFLDGTLQALARWQLPAQALDTAGPAGQFDIDLADEAAVQDWLLSKLRRYLLALPDDIATDQPLASYGLESTVALQLVGDIAALTRREVEPTLLWECPTLNALSARIAQVA